MSLREVKALSHMMHLLKMDYFGYMMEHREAFSKFFTEYQQAWELRKVSKDMRLRLKYLKNEGYQELIRDIQAGWLPLDTVRSIYMALPPSNSDTNSNEDKIK